MVGKDIVIGSLGPHFMHMRVKNVLRINEMFCIILILNILSSKYFAEIFSAFSHSSSYLLLAETFAPFDCRNPALKFPWKVLSFYIRQEILIFSCKVQFLEAE